MHRDAPPGAEAMPRFSQPAPVRHAGKEARLNADAAEMHADARRWAWGQHGASRPTSHHRTCAAAPMRRFLVHHRAPDGICVEACLRRRGSHAAVTALGSRMRARTSCTRRSAMRSPVPMQRGVISSIAKRDAHETIVPPWVPPNPTTRPMISCKAKRDSCETTLHPAPAAVESRGMHHRLAQRETRRSRDAAGVRSYT
jgi:hypothetical protein